MVLVTGGTGLVGSHLLYQLSLQDEPVMAIYRKSSDLSIIERVFRYYTAQVETLLANIIFKEADITDVPALQEVFKNNFKHVYHCAAVISFDSKDYHYMRAVNIQGTANLINLALENHIVKFCFVSSIATIDGYPDQDFITESNDWNPDIEHHGYAITKYGAEMEVWRGSQEGLNVIIVNPGVILGPGLWNSGSGELFVSVAKGFPFYTDGVTGFVGVRDVVQSMISLVKSTTKNERFILVAKNLSFKELFFSIADCLQAKRPAIKATKLLTEIGWRLDWLKGLFSGKRNLTKYTASSSHKKNYYSSAKIAEALSFKFQPIEQVIATTSEKLREEKTMAS